MNLNKVELINFISEQETTFQKQSKLIERLMRESAERENMIAVLVGEEE